MFFIEKVAILGAGLLGASLAKALRSRNIVGTISVWSRSETTRAKCVKLVDVFSSVCATPLEAVKDADFVVLCTPTENIPILAKEIAPFLKNGAIVTDVGSVKNKICAKCAEALEGTGAEFIGSHPMAGSEKIGVDYSDETLFENRPCFIVSSSRSVSLKKVVEMWRSVGMKPYVVSACEHDRIVARISHLPHLLAGTLCVVTGENDTDLRPYAGPGFRDTTRVASGSPDIWDSIIPDNKAEIVSALRDYSCSLNELIAQIESDDGQSVGLRLRVAKKFRDGLI